jgi:hypothetical protein
MTLAKLRIEELEQLDVMIGKFDSSLFRVMLAPEQTLVH